MNHPAKWCAVVAMRISKFGAVLSSMLLAAASYFYFVSLQGAWQAPIFISLATLPFSILINSGFDYVQNFFGLTDSIRPHAETVCTIIFGIFEFYFIGFFIEKDFMSKSAR